MTSDPRSGSGQDRRELAQALMAVWQAYSETLYQAAEAVGLTVPQAMLLDRLDADAAVTMSEIARLLQCDSSNATGMVDRLEHRGLVARQSSTTDRRVREVVLTAAGRTAKAQLTRLSRDDNPLLNRLDAATCRQLTSNLRELLPTTPSVGTRHSTR